MKKTKGGKLSAQKGRILTRREFCLSDRKSIIFKREKAGSRIPSILLRRIKEIIVYGEQEFNDFRLKSSIFKELWKINSSGSDVDPAAFANAVKKTSFLDNSVIKGSKCVQDPKVCFQW